MSNGFNSTTAAALLKTLYPREELNALVYKNRPTLALLPKDSEGSGVSVTCPLIYGNPQGRSATFSKAQSRSTATSTLSKAFVLTWNTDYAIATVSNLLIQQTRNDEGAFVRALQTEIDAAMRTLADSLAVAIFHTGYGELGQVGSFSSGALAFRLANPSDIVNFEVQQALVAAAAVDTGNIRTRGVAGVDIYVSNVDRINGDVTCSVAPDTTATAFAANDYLFAAGDRQESATPTPIKIVGLPGWLVYGGASATSFFGVDRTADKTRLGGLWYDGTAVTSLEEALVNASALAYREGANPDVAIMSPKQYSALVNQLGSKVQYVNMQVGGDAAISFSGVVINGASGEIKVTMDPRCPDNRIFLLQIDTWILYSMGGNPIRMFDTDGLVDLRQADDDGVEVRMYYYAALGNRAPGWNVIINVPVPV